MFSRLCTGQTAGDGYQGDGDGDVNSFHSPVIWSFEFKRVDKQINKLIAKLYNKFEREQ